MKYWTATLLLLIFCSYSFAKSEDDHQRLKRQFGTNIGALNEQGGGSYYTGGRDWGSNLRRFQHIEKDRDSDDIHASRERNYG